MKAVTIFACCLLLGSMGTALAARSAYDAGHRRAIRHGYTEQQAACFGELFSRNAALNQFGHYAVLGRKGRRSPFIAEAWSQCHVFL